MAGENQSQMDLARKFWLRGMTAADADGDQTDATDNAAGGGVLVTTVGSGGTTQTVNSDGSAFVSSSPREAELHNYAATNTAGAGTVIATVTPTIVGVYEVTINYRISTGGSGEAVIDNMQLRNATVAAMRFLTPPVPINSTSDTFSVKALVNWTTGNIDVTQVAASTSTNNTYRVSISAKRVG